MPHTQRPRFTVIGAEPHQQHGDVAAQPVSLLFSDMLTRGGVAELRLTAAEARDLAALLVQHAAETEHPMPREWEAPCDDEATLAAREDAAERAAWRAEQEGELQAEQETDLRDLLARLHGFATHYAHPSALTAGAGLLAAVQAALDRGEQAKADPCPDLLNALHRISLGSQNSGTSKEDLGRLARSAIAKATA